MGLTRLRNRATHQVAAHEAVVFESDLDESVIEFQHTDIDERRRPLIGKQQ